LGEEARIEVSVFADSQLDLIATDGVELLRASFSATTSECQASSVRVEQAQFLTEQYLMPGDVMAIAEPADPNAELHIIPTDELLYTSGAVPMRRMHLLGVGVEPETLVRIDFLQPSPPSAGELLSVSYRPTTWANLKAGWRPELRDLQALELVLPRSGFCEISAYTTVRSMALELPNGIGLVPGRVANGPEVFRCQLGACGLRLTVGVDFWEYELPPLCVGLDSQDELNRLIKLLTCTPEQPIVCSLPTTRQLSPVGGIFLSLRPLSVSAEHPAIPGCFIRCKGGGIGVGVPRDPASQLPGATICFAVEGLPPCSQTWDVDIQLKEVGSDKAIRAAYRLGPIEPTYSQDQPWVLENRKTRLDRAAPRIRF
jgi:hypothetical protein